MRNLGQLVASFLFHFTGEHFCYQKVFIGFLNFHCSEANFERGFTSSNQNLKSISISYVVVSSSIVHYIYIYMFRNWTRQFQTFVKATLQ